MNGWNIIGNTIERNKAQQEYQDSVADVKQSYLDYANDIDSNNLIEDSQNEAAKRNENRVKKDVSLNQLNEGTMASKSSANTSSDFDALYQKAYSEKKDERDTRNKNIIAAKQNASEEAQKKYALAQQAVATSWTNWKNTFKTVFAFVRLFK